GRKTRFPEPERGAQANSGPGCKSFSTISPGCRYSKGRKLGREEGPTADCPDSHKGVMEQNRSFVVILSVTFVLASCFGVAAWLFYPRDAVDRPNDVASFFRPADGQSETLTEDQESADSQVAVEPENPVDAILRDAAAIDDPLGRRLGES